MVGLTVSLLVKETFSNVIEYENYNQLLRQLVPVPLQEALYLDVAVLKRLKILRLMKLIIWMKIKVTLL